MSVAGQVGVLILTYNEEANIQRTLAKLAWSKRILLIDSGSTDGTIEIASRFPHVEVLSRPFDSFANQCNFGLSRIGTPWVLSLDADYELSDTLVEELLTLVPTPNVSGYQARFIYRAYGQSLRGTLYPPRIVLYRRENATYRNEGHGHRVSITGNTLRLAGPIYHDDRKPLSRWFNSQQTYASQEAEHLLGSKLGELGRADRIRRMGWPAPFLVFVYALTVKGCLFDGKAGWFYALQRMLAETMIALAILDRRLRVRQDGSLR